MIKEVQYELGSDMMRWTATYWVFSTTPWQAHNLNYVFLKLGAECSTFPLISLSFLIRQPCLYIIGLLLKEILFLYIMLLYEFPRYDKSLINKYIRNFWDLSMSQGDLGTCHPKVYASYLKQSHKYTIQIFYINYCDGVTDSLTNCLCRNAPSHLLDTPIRHRCTLSHVLHPHSHWFPLPSDTHLFQYLCIYPSSYFILHICQ